MYKEDRSQFWEDIYLADDAGWDLGGVTPVSYTHLTLPTTPYV